MDVKHHVYLFLPEDLKVSQIGSSPLPPPFRGLHSLGVRKYCQIIFACYFRKSSITYVICSPLTTVARSHAGFDYVITTSTSALVVVHEQKNGPFKNNNKTNIIDKSVGCYADFKLVKHFESLYSYFAEMHFPIESRNCFTGYIPKWRRK